MNWFKQSWSAQTEPQKLVLICFFVILVVFELPLLVIWATRL